MKALIVLLVSVAACAGAGAAFQQAGLQYLLDPQGFLPALMGAGGSALLVTVSLTVLAFALKRSGLLQRTYAGELFGIWLFPFYVANFFPSWAILLRNYAPRVILLGITAGITLLLFGRFGKAER